MPEPRNLTLARVPLASGACALWANAGFKRLLSAWFLNGVANALPATLFVYFVSDRLGAPDAAGPLLLLYFVSAIIALPVVLRLSRGAHTDAVWRYSLMLTCMVFPFAALVGPGSLAAFAAICALTGFLLAFDLALPAAIQADVVEADLALSGEQRAGLLFALWGATSKLALACATVLGFGLLEAMGYAPGNGADGSVLVWLYAVAPVLPKLAAMVIMRGYQDTVSMRR